MEKTSKSQKVHQTVFHPHAVDLVHRGYDGACWLIDESGGQLGEAFTNASDGLESLMGLISIKGFFSQVTQEIKHLNPMKHKISVVADAGARLADRGLSLSVVVGIVASIILGFTLKKSHIPVELLNGLWLGGAALALGRSSVASKRNLTARGALGTSPDEAINEWKTEGKSSLWLKDAIGTSDLENVNEVYKKAVRQTSIAWTKNLLNALSVAGAVISFVVGGAAKYRAPIMLLRAAVAVYLVLQVVGWVKPETPGAGQIAEGMELNVLPHEGYGSTSESSGTNSGSDVSPSADRYPEYEDVPLW